MHSQSLSLQKLGFGKTSFLSQKKAIAYSLLMVCYCGVRWWKINLDLRFLSLDTETLTFTDTAWVSVGAYCFMFSTD